KRPAQPAHQGRRHGLEGDADAEIGGPPYHADRGPGEIGEFAMPRDGRAHDATPTRAGAGTGSREVSLRVSSTIVVRVDRTPGIRPNRVRSSCPRCSAS